MSEKEPKTISDNTKQDVATKTSDESFALLLFNYMKDHGKKGDTYRIIHRDFTRLK